MKQSFYGTRNGKYGKFFYDWKGNLYFEHECKITLCKKALTKHEPCPLCGTTLKYNQKDFCPKCDKELTNLIMEARKCQ